MTEPTPPAGEPPAPEQRDVPQDVFERMVLLRRDLHRHPELAWEEERTAARIADRLRELGLSVRTGVAGTGIVADIAGGDGPVVALRADMDALPIEEETGLPFASGTPGIMHACGHDGHCSMLVGAAELLTRNGPPPSPVRLLFQPAEEQTWGARKMIEEGALEGVSHVFGGHIDRHYAPGVLAVADGTVNASTDRFCISISGRGGHGGRPHEALDAVVVGSLLVTAIQTIVSREVDPAHPSVVSVGTFEAGTAPNVIAHLATLTGTIRAHDPAVRAHLKDSVARIANAVGELHQALVEVAFPTGTPPVVNAPEMARVARRAGRDALGPERVASVHTVNMGGEDFAWYLENVPGAFVRFGGRAAGRESYPAHSSRFDFDERALASGAAWFAEVARFVGSGGAGETGDG